MNQLLLFFQLLCCCQLLAQQPAGLVFAVSATETQTLLTTEDPSLDFLENRMPLDDYRSGYQLDSLPFGHYLIVEAQGEHLQWRTYSNNQHQLLLHKDEKHLNISIVDLEGQPVDSAQLQLEKHEIPYMPDAQHYQSRRTKGGLLVAYLPNDTILYQLNIRHASSVHWRHFWYFSRSKVGYVITTPARWTSRAYVFVRNLAKRGYWNRYSWPFERLINRIRYREDRSFRGYIATQQPLYRLGDTLRMSAYLAKDKGRPFRKTVALNINTRGTFSFSTLLKTEIPGHYAFEWVLNDSLPIDQSYQLRLIAGGWRNPRSLSYTFRIEDYELDEYTFDITDAESSFTADQPVVFKLKAEDTNGLPVAATTVSGQLLSNYFIDPYGETNHAPDTLWQFQEEFGNRTEIELLPPDSIWPQAHLNSVLEVNFQGPSGEIEQLEHHFQVNRPGWSPIIRLQADSIIVGISGTPPAGALKGELTAINGAKTLAEISLRPGETVPLNPLATHYRWTVAEKSVALSLWKESAQLSFSYTWLNDSLQLNWTNPRKLPLEWQLDSKANRLAQGADSSEVLTLQLPYPQNKRQLWLHYNYPWNGELVNEESSIRAVNQRLYLELEVPEKVYPGQTGIVTVRARDSRNRPAAGVVLTNAAYNTQFRKGNAYETSDIRFKGRRAPFVRQVFSGAAAKVQGKDEFNDYWYRQLGLDSQLYYQIRFPAPTGFFQYQEVLSSDSLAQTTAQLSPWLVNQHQLQPLVLAYLDNQLVYYQPAWQNTPYVITAQPGYHTLTLRSREHEVTIDSVLLKAGQRLDISFDLARFDSKRLRVKNKPTYLDLAERQHISAKLFFIRYPDGKQEATYLFSDQSQVFRLSRAYRGYSGSWGLFENGSALTLMTPGTDTLQFRFESFFSYELGGKRDRLYEHRPLLRTSGKPGELSKFIPHPQVGDSALFSADIPPNTQPWYWKVDDYTSDTAPDHGRLQLFLQQPPNTPRTQLLILSKGEEIIYLLDPKLKIIALPSGNYQLTGLTTEDSIWKVDLSIQAHQLQSATLVTDALKVRVLPPLWQSVLERKTSQEPSSQSVRHDRSSLKRYRRGSRLISGYITDDSGEPLIGASILAMGTSVGTVTDIDGYYELWLPDGASEMVVSYTGFQTTQFAIAGQSVMDIALHEGVHLDEVIVSGLIRGYASGVTLDDVNVRGSRDENTSYYIDGVRVEGKLISESEGRLAGVMAAKPPDLQMEQDPLAEIGLEGVNALSLPIDSLRESFRDYAYWQPQLRTNRAGEISFPVTFPDDVTNWHHYAVGMDRKARLGVGQAYTQAYLPLQAQLYTPRFLLRGDQAQVIGVLTNRSGEQQSVETNLLLEGRSIQSNTYDLELSTKEYFPLPTVDGTQDSIWLHYQLKAGEYQDGERRAIPVYRQGVKQTIGGYVVLRDEQTQLLNTEADKGPIQLRLSGNNLPRILEELAYLRDYPYHCNEQTASRLLALLATKSLDTYRGDAPDLGRKIRACIRRLERNTQANGSWGWWKNSSSGSSWITQHVLSALQAAEANGYDIAETTNAKRFLLNQLNFVEGNHQLDLLLFFAEQGQVLDYAKYLQAFDSLSRDLPTELAYRRIQQLQDLPYSLDSLEVHRQKTLTGGHYWDRHPVGIYDLYGSNVQLNLLAYRLYQSAEQQGALAPIRQYFLEPDPEDQISPKSLRMGANTYESAQLVQAFLADIQSEEKVVEPVSIHLQKDQTPPQLIGQLPVAQMHSSGSALRVSKQGDGPAFVAYSQTYWDNNPAVQNNGFQLQTRLWQNKTETTQWITNQPAVLETTVTTSGDASYVMIEIPVPAGCSYGNKVFYELPNETRREYHRDKVVVFCESLPMGTYQLTVNLDARYPGRYTINPARAEMMYVPSINGVGEMLEVEIEE